MRSEKQIEAEIADVKKSIATYKGKLTKLCKEMSERLSYDLERVTGIKRGDILNFGNRGTVCYDYVDYSLSMPFIHCLKMKKDGTPSFLIRRFTLDEFDNFEVVGHFDLPEKN